MVRAVAARHVEPLLVGRCTLLHHCLLVLRGSEGGGKWNGAWRGLVIVLELIGLRPYIYQPPVYERLICTVMYMSDRLLTQTNPNSHLPFPPELRGLKVS